MQTITTQKHDYTTKPCSKRLPIVLTSHLRKASGPISKETVNRLSYMKPFPILKAMSFKPILSFNKPTMPQDDKTIQKLSFTPVCPAPRECPPWAKKPKFQHPNVPLEKGTTYQLSFIPNCGDIRVKPFRPSPNGFGPVNASLDDTTIYKASYFEPTCVQRPAPIKPVPQLGLSKCTLDDNTCYKVML